MPGKPDIDAQETQEWLDALEAVLENEGVDRAHYLLERLIDKARRSGAYLPYSANTAYVNSIQFRNGILTDAEVAALGGATSASGIPGAVPHPAYKPAGCPFHPRCPQAIAACRRSYPGMCTFEDGHTARCPVAAGRGDGCDA